ncbi:MAG: hypothetical protein COA73_10835 [Candidatus Hydrogenedentota bacterium]|nr:MAG: hypothetical protein COA73_10835 [Candidatus Hydrogenedentota bacterium]
MYQSIAKKMKLAVAATVIGAMAPMSMASAASVQDVVDKYIEATGGRDAQAGVKSMTRKGQFMLVDMGMGAGLESYMKDGNFIQTIAVEGMGEVVQGITGDVVWQMHFMEGDSVLEGEQADGVKVLAQVNPYLDWENNFGAGEITGEEDGATIVTFTGEDGNDSVVYFNNETGLISKSEGVGLDGSPATTNYSDYKEVGGINFAHTMEILGAMTIEITIDTIEVNGDISDDTFTVPEVIQAMLPEEDTGGVTAEQVMTMMDADGDGKITMEEAPEQLQGAFGMVDMNADGGIDLEEAQLIADFMNG